MKNSKEVQAILAAIFALNRTSEHKDPYIDNLLDYAFRRLYGSNTNLLSLACIGKTYEEMQNEVQALLACETNFIEYVEGKPFNK